SHIISQIKFKVNDDLELTLSDSALEHILTGDIGERLVMQDNKRTGDIEKILKGGMHSVDGFLAFKQLHEPNKLEHLLFYNSNKNKYWYYARELQNGVINIRLPKELFQSKAAKLTNFPDEHYKSGYLWKTLFPDGWGKHEILEAITEALKNIDEEASSNGEIVGYIFKDEPLKMIRICILYRNGKINSAFPSWTQPCTGNNGKPYSHFDSIGHVIAESTLFFDSADKISAPPDTNLLGESYNIFELVNTTPDFIINREFVGEGDIDTWSNEKNFHLMECAGHYGETEIKSVKSYLQDELIVKHNYLTPQSVYRCNYFDFIFSKPLYNTIQLHQNIIDCLMVIRFYDLFKNTNHSREVISFLMKNMVTCTGGLDSWNKKRILNTIIDNVLSHHDKNLSADFIHWLVDSPWRRELFIDINCGTFGKLDITPNDVVDNDGGLHHSLYTIHVTEQPIKCTLTHFMYYYKLMLGETYLINFKHDELTDIVNQHIDTPIKYFISDSIKYTRSKDLMLFSEQFQRLIRHIILNGAKHIDEESILITMKDYYRIQSAQRFRMNLYFKDVIGHELDYENVKSNAFIRGTCIKHERMCNTFSMDIFFSACEMIGSYIKSPKIISEVAKLKVSYTKDTPPLPDVNHLRI
ncbi:hypothetical protein ACLHZU_14300, partial [Aeromonas salmonicida]